MKMNGVMNEVPKHMKRKGEMMKNEIMSVQFRDDYMVIETLTRTHSIKKTEVGEGEWDSLQALLLQISDRGYKKKKYYDWNSDGIDKTIR